MSKYTASSTRGRAATRPQDRLRLVCTICALLLAATLGVMTGASRVSGEVADVAASFAAANADLAADRPARAVPIYQEIRERHGVSPELLLNLGNASFRAGDVGGAVLAYEQALLLAPRQAEVLANLRLVRHEANLPADEPDLAHWIVAQLSMDGWAIVLVGALAAAAIVLLVSLLRGERVAGVRTTPAGARLAAFALLALAAGAAAAWAVRWGDLDRAVVVEASEPFLRVAPYESASRSAPLAAGQIVVIERQLPGFALVRTSDGRAGWAEIGAVQRIVPKES